MITGTEDDDVIDVGHVSINGVNYVEVSGSVYWDGLNDTPAGDLAVTSAVTSISVNGLDGDDSIDLEDVNSFFGGFANLDGSITIDAGPDEDTVKGSLFGETIYGGGENDIIEGGSGNDFLWGHEGIDTIDGGFGNDFIVGGEPEENDDDILRGGPGVDEIYGGGGGDFINGGWGSDKLYGGPGFDTIHGDTDDAFASGYGAGDDLIYASLKESVGEFWFW